jgi:hypothetical protein
MVLSKDLNSWKSELLFAVNKEVEGILKLTNS